MSSALVTKSSAVKFPKSAASAYGTFRFDVSATAISLVLPAEVKGNFIKVSAFGADAQVAVGAATTLVFNQKTATFGAASAAVGGTISNGGFIDGICDKGATHLNVVASGAGTIEVYISEIVAP